MTAGMHTIEHTTPNTLADRSYDDDSLILRLQFLSWQHTFTTWVHKCACTHTRTHALHTL